MARLCWCVDVCPDSLPPWKWTNLTNTTNFWYPSEWSFETNYIAFPRLGGSDGPGNMTCPTINRVKGEKWNAEHEDKRKDQENGEEEEQWRGGGDGEEGGQSMEIKSAFWWTEAKESCTLQNIKSTQPNFNTNQVLSVTLLLYIII